MVKKKPKITYEPSEELKKRRKERRGVRKEEKVVEKAVEKTYVGKSREGDGRRYTADRCFDEILVKGERLYVGIIADTKSDDLISILKYKEV
jgi:hypothetical protein